jgi:glycerol-3-phosphate O-acyltransferase / dihydroxyacetone phosphate acyltransferase
MGISIRIFYKNIKVKNLGYLPVNRPVIIASNHPNAFLDAMVISIIAKQKINYLVRSDVFNTGFKRWLFGQIGLIPIYRIQEGADQLHKNEETFKKCNELLSKNASIIMFPEGICIQEKRLRKLKKGLARIAFGAEEAHGGKLGLAVVPVGMNYSNAKNFRSRLYIEFGKPVEVKDYLEEYQKDKNKTINEFTKQLEAKMAEHLIIIENKQNDEMVENISEVYKKELMRSKDLNPHNLEHDFQIMRDITKAISFFEQYSSDLVEVLRIKLSDYRTKLSSLRLRDHLLRKEHIENLSVKGYFRDMFFLIFGFPVHLYGLINHYIPYKISIKLTDKIVRNVEFHSSLNVAFGTFLTLIFYIIQVSLVSIFFDWRITLLYIITLPLSGLFSLYYWHHSKKATGHFRLLSLVKKRKPEIEDLIRSRAVIISALDQAREAYKTQKAIRNN